MPATCVSSIAATQSGLVDLFRTSLDHIINFFGLHGGQDLAHASTLVAAVSRVRPRLKLITAWDCQDLWGIGVPAVPVKALSAGALLLVQSDQLVIGTVVLSGLVGLVRASVVLYLSWKN